MYNLGAGGIRQRFHHISCQQRWCGASIFKSFYWEPAIWGILMATVLYSNIQKKKCRLDLRRHGLHLQLTRKHQSTWQVISCYPVICFCRHPLIFSIYYDKFSHFLENKSHLCWYNDDYLPYVNLNYIDYLNNKNMKLIFAVILNYMIIFLMSTCYRSDNTIKSGKCWC
jgi:hypothetical protein